MAYEKQVWECGDVVTAEKLNHIEEGIESASESGGGTVEVIKIAENINGGSSSTSAPYLFTGGKMNLSPTIGESVGDKQIIGFVLVASYTDKQSKSRTAESSLANVTARNGDDSFGEGLEVISNQSSDSVRNATTIDVCGMFTSYVTPSTVDIYAICI